MPASHPDGAALLSEAEVQRLLLAASERAPSGVRNRALIALLYCSGLRLGEALALRPGDLDLERSEVRVRAPRARAAHVFPAAQPYLETWLLVRAERQLSIGALLFCTLAGGALEPAYVRAMLARLARRAGLAKRVHAHLLRHSCAGRLARSGLDAQGLAAQLGQLTASSARRSVARYGVCLSARGVSRACDVPWSLAPAPGAVRAWVGYAPRNSPPERVAAGQVVVERWHPPDL